MRILDWIFGERIIKDDDFFGRIKSDKTRNNEATKSLDWNIEKRIGHFENETYIILGGNSNGIDPTQKQELRKFIENFEAEHSLKLDQLIAADNKYDGLKNWKDNFHLAFISPLSKSNTKFEINFEKNDGDDQLTIFCVELINGELKNISV